MVFVVIAIGEWVKILKPILIFIFRSFKLKGVF